MVNIKMLFFPLLTAGVLLSGCGNNDRTLNKNNTNEESTYSLNNNNNEEVVHSLNIESVSYQKKWEGSFYMLRDHQDEKFILAGNEAWAYIYHSFPTKIGEVYEIKATLIGADESRKGNFEGGSVLAIAEEKPTEHGGYEIAQSEIVTGDIPTEIHFTFTATSDTSYVVLRGDTRYKYPNLYSYSIKQITEGFQSTTVTFSADNNDAKAEVITTTSEPEKVTEQTQNSVSIDSNNIEEETVITYSEPEITTAHVKYPWEHGKLKINGRIIQHEDGTGFFWMSDTAWYLSKRLKDEEVVAYLNNRKSKGFNVVQMSIPNRKIHQNVYGNKAFNGSYSKPNKDFWKHIDYIINEAEKRGMYIGLLPTWNLGITNTGDAKIYGKFIANRYKNKKNIIWINGGDTYPTKSGHTQKNIWDALGNTIKDIVGNKQLMTFHPGTSIVPSKIFNGSSGRWLDFNMIQSGHCSSIKDANSFLKGAYQNSNIPILDGEPRYEDIEKCFYKSNRSGERWQDRDIREIAYKQVFSGAFGHTYGHESIWQMHRNGDKDEAGTVSKTWIDALNDPGAFQVGYLAKLMRSRPLTSRVPDQSIIASGNGIATRGNGYLFVYFPKGGNVTLNLGKISGDKIKAWWYNPTTGDATEIGIYSNQGRRTFTASGSDDRVLVIDDLAKGYATPGL
jgi:hypothetical protein